MEGTFFNPKCRFGRDDQIVGASYVKCTPQPRRINEEEAPTSEKTATCLQCEHSPPGDHVEKVPFTVSLTGDFSDIENSVPYEFYDDPTLTAINPRYGVKDGNTRVDIWGPNFVNYDQYTRCLFGSKSVPAVWVDESHMYCHSPPSDVVG